MVIRSSTVKQNLFIIHLVCDWFYHYANGNSKALCHIDYQIYLSRIDGLGVILLLLILAMFRISCDPFAKSWMCNLFAIVSSDMTKCAMLSMHPLHWPSLNKPPNSWSIKHCGFATPWILNWLENALINKFFRVSYHFVPTGHAKRHRW